MAYFEIPQPPATWETRMTFVCDRTEIKTDLSRLSDGSESPADWSVYLGNDRLTYVDERIRKMAMEVTKGKATSLEKAKAIYDYTVSIMVYDKTHQGWGRGDVSHACDVKKGNCTDFHALFQALCRAVGIPAGFEIGLYLPYEKGPASDLGGYHCWAFFRVPGRTWVPVDCSEASRVASLREYFFGNQTNNRVTLSMGRDLVLNPPQAGEPLNYFLNPHAEADGVPVTAEKTWSFKDLNP
jgi:transglutaminase-like putative cysteine protease